MLLLSIIFNLSVYLQSGMYCQNIETSDDLGDEDIKALIKDYVRRTKKI